LPICHDSAKSYYRNVVTKINKSRDLENNGSKWSVPVTPKKEILGGPAPYCNAWICRELFELCNNIRDSLPQHIREITDKTRFKRHLKTVLFQMAFLGF